MTVAATHNALRCGKIFLQILSTRMKTSPKPDKLLIEMRVEGETSPFIQKLAAVKIKLKFECISKDHVQGCIRV